MENLSVKVLDALFDLCDGESYVILDKEDITQSFGEDVDTAELTEALETLSVEKCIDLRYADNTEYCIAMLTKGRTLIKQSREKMQRLRGARKAEGVVEERTDAPAAKIEEPIVGTSTLDFASESTDAFSATIRSERRLPVEGDATNEVTGDYTTRRDEAEKAAKKKERRAFFAALIGAAVGSFLMDLIFLIIILVKLAG